MEEKGRKTEKVSREGRGISVSLRFQVARVNTNVCKCMVRAWSESILVMDSY